MKQRLSTVLKRMTQNELAEIMRLKQARISKLLLGTQGETMVWVHFIERGWEGDTFHSPEVTHITYHDKYGGLKTILRKEQSE